MLVNGDVLFFSFIYILFTMISFHYFIFKYLIVLNLSNINWNLITPFLAWIQCIWFFIPWKVFRNMKGLKKDSIVSKKFMIFKWWKIPTPTLRNIEDVANIVSMKSHLNAHLTSWSAAPYGWYGNTWMRLRSRLTTRGKTQSDTTSNSFILFG